MICLLVITDGRRDCVSQTIPSALANLQGSITRRILYDDSGDPDHRDWLASNFPTFELVWHLDGRQGFGGAIRCAWTHVLQGPEPFVFHLEDDFTFNRRVPLDDLIHTLDHNPHLTQLALRRQAWNEHERLAGGVIEQHPDQYEDRSSPHGSWLEHRLFFTTNPSLYRRSLCERGWPEGDRSEGRFTIDLLADPEIRFGYWGSRFSGLAVTHIGKERVGSHY